MTLRPTLGVWWLTAAAGMVLSISATRSPDIPYRTRMLDGGASETVAIADGYPDLVSVTWFAKKISWFRNPGKAGGTWAEAPIDSGFPVEFALLVDLDNDGKAQELLPQPGATSAPLAWYEVKAGAWVKHVVSPQSYGHGIGAGDVNKDGRADILTPRGWVEAPADPRSGAWTFHPDWEAVNVTAPGAGAAANAAPKVTELGFMHVADVNGDGRNDVIAGAAHDYGVFWFEQGEGGKWTRRTIDIGWSQAHASTLVDLNGDGQPELVTGKRFMAHNGSDPGEREPLGVYWFEYKKGTAPGSVEWIRHIVDFGGRMGGGMQIPVVDIDGDGDLDIVCAGKSGLFIAENVSKNK